MWTIICDSYMDITQLLELNLRQETNNVFSFSSSEIQDFHLSFYLESTHI